jgi:Zn-finger protein
MQAEILGKSGLKIFSLNRRRAVREKCLNCSCWSVKDVENCKFHDCPLYPFRSGQGKQTAKARAKAIRDFCVWCMVGQKAEVKKCVSVHCPLFGFRRGKAEKGLSMPKKAYQEAFFKAKSPG